MSELERGRVGILERERRSASATVRGRAGRAPELGAPRTRRRRWMLAAGAVALTVAAFLVWRQSAKPAAPAYGMATVTRQTIARTVNATGVLQAVTTVQVGTQVSGSIAALFADFNSQVNKGQVIARLDPSQFQAQLAQANAALASAQAAEQGARTSIVVNEAAAQAAQANVERTEAVLADAQRSLDRTRQLVEARVAAATDLQAAETAVAQAAAQRQQAVAQLNQARAQAQAARSQVAQAQAQAQQARAAVELARVNLEHTVIRAPIDGVVVARNVDVGQTVAASLQAPVIFLIANDLTKMQVLANIDEADVGQLTPESEVNFTVDAYPADTFSGRVSQIRLSPQTVQNVVTYTAVIDVSNPEMKLKPGMTANVSVIAQQREDVLAVPNGALRFRPEGQALEPAASNGKRGGGGQTAVWKVTETGLTRVPVQLGLSDGTATEIVSGDLNAGDKVAVAALPAGTGPQAGRGGTRSPFQMGGRRGR